MWVATYAPMKRGLKVKRPVIPAPTVICSNLCPDEKGTESFGIRFRFSGRLIVATYAPMKRGLKG